MCQTLTNLFDLDKQIQVIRCSARKTNKRGYRRQVVLVSSSKSNWTNTFKTEVDDRVNFRTEFNLYRSEKEYLLQIVGIADHSAFGNKYKVILFKEPKDFIAIIEDEENGIKNLVIDCEEPILVLEQVILKVSSRQNDLFKRLLQMNRNLVHGAFALDEDAQLVIFRDTLQLENLDRNELESSIHALSIALSEYGSELLEYAA